MDDNLNTHAAPPSGETPASPADTPGSFRDRMSIVTNEGGRKWIFPRQPSGVFYRARTWLSLLLLAILFGVPLIKVDGHPVMLLNLVERKFILFGAMFGPHDFFILGLSVIAFVVFIILFTVVFGRIFCGWVCPQTVLMEMIFRKIDYWLEGDFRAQRNLAASPWTGNKIRRKFTKYVIYFGISFLIANMLLSWIIGIDALRAIVTDPPAQHLAGLTAILAFSGVFYWIFIWFREQACILVCPYGRLQGVLLDQHSVVIAYDHVRGEPRAKYRKNPPPGAQTAGDCIDCGRCVEVCPTGIDIRNGTQLECVNCTACIDACDSVMESVQRPKSLIRYASAHQITNKTGFKLTFRVVGYSAVLAVLVTVVSVLLATRTSIDVTVLRTPGMFFQEQADGKVSNIYDVKAVNKTFAPMPIYLALENMKGEVRMLGGNVVVPPQGIVEGKMMLILPAEEIRNMSTPVVITVFNGEKRVGTTHSTFLGPVKKR
jgi:cytochrome c oxidase accessory protein FixG